VSIIYVHCSGGWRNHFRYAAHINPISPLLSVTTSKSQVSTFVVSSLGTVRERNLKNSQ